MKKYIASDFIVLDVCNENGSAEVLAKKIGCSYVKCLWRQFNDGELELLNDFNCFIENKRVLIYQSLHYPYDIFFKVLVLLRALKSYTVSDITLLSPYVGYIRPHYQIIAESIFDVLFYFGVKKIITIHPHSVELFTNDKYSGRIFVIDPVNIFIDLIRQRVKCFGIRDLCFLSPDAGARRVNELCAGYFNVPCHFATKLRDKDSLTIKIDVEIPHKNVFVIDDIIDTGLTLECLVKEIIRKNKDVRVFLFCTHAILSRYPSIVDSNNVAELTITSSLPVAIKHKKIFIYELMENNYLIKNIWQIINLV